MPTDNEKSDFLQGVLKNMEKVAKENNVPMERLVVRYSTELQENGLPEYYRIEVAPCQ